MRGNGVANVRDGIDFRAVNAQDDVAALETCATCGRIERDLEDEDAFFKRELIAVTRRGRFVENRHAEIRAGDVAFIHEFVDDRFDGVNRNCEAHAFDAVGRKFRAVDADNFTVRVDECAARIAGTDCRVRLEKFDASVVEVKRAVQRADNADGHRALKFKPHRVADCDCGFADDDFIRIAERRSRKIFRVDFDDGNVGHFVRAD